MQESDKILLRSAWEAFTAFSPGSVADVRVFFAPGRVNLIGEHTDYNGGYVFPAALSLGTWVFVRPRDDGSLRFASTAFSAQVRVTVHDLQFAVEDDYANYPKGVMWALAQAGVKLTGADCLFAGNMPNSAGLSSSASVEMATAVAMDALAGSHLPRVELVKLGQKAENQFVGVNSGIMDQFASGMGKAEHALLLDCATLDYRLVPIHMPQHHLVMANTNKKRGLADSKYNERWNECQQALALLQVVRPTLQHLAEIDPAEWDFVQEAVTDPVLLRRVHHVVFEHARTKAAADRLGAGDLVAFGELMNASHASLRDDYEVTGPELDALAEAAWDVEGCIGSRMTGAGFGGCTVSLVRNDALEVFQSQVAARYEKSTGLRPTFYISAIGDGAREVTQEVQVIWRS